MASAASLQTSSESPRWVLYGVSALAHVGLAVLIFAYPVHKAKKYEKVAVAIHETKKAKPPEPVKPPEPPKAEPPPPPAAPKMAAPPPKAAPPKAAAPAAVASAVPDLGMVGASGSGGNGPVLPAAGGQPTGAEPVSNKPPPPKDECSEGPSKAKRVEGPQPTYTQDAREAEIEGVVKVEVTIDESGKVISAKVVASLGHGLDEAALEAAREWTFEAATKCGKAVAGSSTLPFRFKLDS